MLDTIADIRSRLGTCRQRDADTATLLGIVDTYVEQLKAVQARANKAERTLESLTPGGSEFHGSPENCADWVRDQRKTLYNALCRAMDERNQSQGAMARMRGDYEAYVRNNCQLIRHSVADGLGYPKEVEDKCGGYAQNYDEPHKTCQNCIAAYDPETESTGPGGAVAGLIDAVGELEKHRFVITDPGNGLTVYAIMPPAMEAVLKSYAKVVGK